MGGGAFDPDSAFVHLDEFPGNGQAQTCAVLAGTGQIMGLDEAVQNLFHILFAQAWAVVPDGNFDVVGAVGYNYIDLAAGGDKFNGVADADNLEKVYMFAFIAVIMLVGIYPAILTDTIKLGILPIVGWLGG